MFTSFKIFTGLLPTASHTAPVSPLCAAPVPLCFARSSDSVGRSGAKLLCSFTGFSASCFAHRLRMSLCDMSAPLCFARSSDSVGRSGAKIPLEFLLAYCIASAPAMISVSSCVMELCLARLYCSESLLIMSSAFSVAESIACIRAAFSLAIDSRNAP